MLRIHATWLNGPERPALALLGEEISSTPLELFEDEDDSRRHPFLLPARALRSLLRDVADGLLYECAEEVVVVCAWPTQAGSPLPSQSATPLAEPGVAMDVWRAEALSLPPREVPRFLAALLGETPPGINLAPTVRYWARASRFAQSLLSRGRFVPVLVEEDGRRGLRARWRPVLTADPDRAGLRELAEVLPQFGREARYARAQEESDEAEVEAIGEELIAEVSPPDASTSARAHLLSFLDAVVDALLRTQLAEAAMLERGRLRGTPPPGPLGAWLRALSWIDDRIELRSHALEDLAGEIRQWNRDVLDPEGGRTRLRLELDTPPADDPSALWKLDFFLEAVDDPTARVPAALVWSSRVVRQHGRSFPHAVERLLSDLRTAALIVPGLQRALEETAPTQAILTVHEAYALLSAAKTELAAAGIAFTPPSWWEERVRTPVLRLHLRPESESQTEEESSPSGLLAYDWEIALGDARLSPEEFHALTASQRPLLRFGDRWVELPPGGNELAERVLREKQTRPLLTLAEAMRIGLGGLTSRGHIPRPEIIADGWIAHLLSHLHGETQPEAIEPGEGFVGELRPYQNRGVGWLHYLERHGLGGCLADDMGLGKTVQLIALLVHERRGVVSNGLPDGAREAAVAHTAGAGGGTDATSGVAVSHAAGPVSGAASPVSDPVSAPSGATSPVRDAASAASGATSPVSDAASAASPAASPVRDVRSALSSAANPVSEAVSAVSGAASPVSEATGAAGGAMEAADAALNGRTGQSAPSPFLAREYSGSLGPTLVLAPMSVVGNWQREVQRFAPGIKVLVHHGLGRMRDGSFAQEVANSDLVISTYALARRDLELLKEVLWHRIVLDEAQNIKNPSTQQAKAVRSLVSRHRVALTGTPVENNLAELWSILDFLNPGYLGTAAEFRRRFVRPVERQGNRNREQLLKTLARPLILRRLKSDPDVVRDLPEKLEMRVYCNLTREQAALYQAVVDEMLGRIDQSTGIRRRGLVLTALTRLKQICNHPAHYLGETAPMEGRSGKVERLVEMLEEVRSVGDRALCFTQYAMMGKLLQRYLSRRLKTRVIFLHGGTAPQKRDEMVKSFQDPDGPPIFLLSVRAGGTGLNLTAANHVFHFDRWWNPAVEDQASDRAHRIGQLRTVQVHKLVCVGTLEERIDRVIEDKRALASQVLGSGESWLTELSTEQLREVLTLSRDAVSEDA